MTPLGRIRALVCDRAQGQCEACGCYVGEEGEQGHLDHQFGRGHLAEAVSNCWLLCPPCDQRKTGSRPSAAWWLTRFTVHAKRYRYTAEIERAEARIAVLAQKFPGVA